MDVVEGNEKIRLSNIYAANNLQEWAYFFTQLVSPCLSTEHVNILECDFKCVAPVEADTLRDSRGTSSLIGSMEIMNLTTKFGHI